MCSLERLCRPVQERRSAMPVARVPDAAGIVRRMDAAANPGPRPRERRPINHPDKREAFRDLGLDAVRVAQRTPRIRQHVNPLKIELQQKAELVAHAAFADPHKPLVVDVGCGQGRFALALARQQPACNVLALDIREPLIDRAKSWAAELGFDRRLCFLTANATINMRALLEHYPGAVRLVCVQFCDPHRKRKHLKRHIVQPGFVRDVASVMESGGYAYITSDVEDVARYMRSCFERAGPWFDPVSFASPLRLSDAPTAQCSTDAPAAPLPLGGNAVERRDHAWADAEWLHENPLDCPTERELHVLSQGGTCFRMLLRRNAQRV